MKFAWSNCGLVGPIVAPPPLATANASMKLSSSASTRFTGQRPSGVDANFAVARCLKLTMQGFVVWIALRRHVPLRSSVENP